MYGDRMTLSAQKTIASLLDEPESRSALFRDAEEVLAARVAASRGLSGMAIRTGFAAFQKVQPGIVRSALDRLGPHFAPPMDDHWSRACETDDPSGYFRIHASSIADDLLGVTDDMAERATSTVLLSIYRSLRGRAQSEVVAAMPDVAGLLRRHLG